VLEAVFVLLEYPSPSRRIFIGSHSLPPPLWFTALVLQRGAGLRGGDAAVAAVPTGQREGNKKAGSKVTWAGPDDAGWAYHENKGAGWCLCSKKKEGNRKEC
jgi:hypothetical protein